MTGSRVPSQMHLEETMKPHSNLFASTLVSAVLALCALLSAPDVRAQQAVDPDAQAVLGAMTKYLGSLKSFTVEYAAADEVITPDGQKRQLLYSADAPLHRTGSFAF